MRGQERTCRHEEGSGEDVQARGVRRGRAGTRSQERTRRHKEGSEEDVWARGGVRRGRAGTRRGQEWTRGHEWSGEDARARGGVRNGHAGMSGQERTRGHEERSGEDTRARRGVRTGCAGTTRGQGGCQETQREEAAPLPSVWTPPAHFPDPELRPSPQSPRQHGRPDQAAAVSHALRHGSGAQPSHSGGGRRLGSHPTSRAWGLTWEVSLAYFMHRLSTPMKSAWMLGSV